jgi:hypothetical protein
LTSDEELFYAGLPPYQHGSKNAIDWNNARKMKMTSLLQFSMDSHKRIFLKTSSLFIFCQTCGSSVQKRSNIIEIEPNDTCIFILDCDQTLYWRDCEHATTLHPIKGIPLKDNEKIHLLCGALSHLFIVTSMNILLLCLNRSVMSQSVNNTTIASSHWTASNLYEFKEIELEGKGVNGLRIEQLHFKSNSTLLIVDSKGGLWYFGGCLWLFRGEPRPFTLTKLL